MLQWAVMPELTAEQRAHWFGVGAITDPRPGWALAPFSHVSTLHFASNVVGVAVLGGLVESFIPRRHYAAVLATAAVIPVLAQALAFDVFEMSYWAQGASGIAHALAGFLAVWLLHAPPRPTRLAGGVGGVLLAGKALRDVVTKESALLGVQVAAAGHVTALAIGAVVAVVLAHRLGPLPVDA